MDRKRRLAQRSLVKGTEISMAPSGALVSFLGKRVSSRNSADRDDVRCGQGEDCYAVYPTRCAVQRSINPAGESPAPAKVVPAG